MKQIVKAELLKVDVIKYKNKQTGEPASFAKVTLITEENELVFATVGREIDVPKLETLTRVDGKALIDVTTQNDGTARVVLEGFESN